MKSSPRDLFDLLDLKVPEPGAGRVVLHDTPWVLLAFPETKALVWVDLTQLPHSNLAPDSEETGYADETEYSDEPEF
tara:strand:- start:17915 stop:18145 length:231 start_codon:yes stop_codon:yes gene_type:complete